MIANSTDIVAASHDPDAHAPNGMPTASTQTKMMAFIWRGDTPRRALTYAIADVLSPTVKTPVASTEFPQSALRCTLAT